MGISLGSSSKKPYVGSKEVQEAYVGNQLVYRAVPPFNGVFFDSATQTILDGYVLKGSSSQIGYQSGSFLASNGYYIKISNLSGGERGAITWANIDVGIFNTLIIKSPMLSNYARSYRVLITFEDNTTINTTVQIWHNNPAQIALKGAKIKNVEIQNYEQYSDGYLSNITVV